VTVFQISYEYLCGDYNDVIRVSACGSKDTIHYIYSSYGLPSVLIARTDTESGVVFDCSQFHNANTSVESGSVRFTHPPHAVMVLVFTRVCCSDVSLRKIIFKYCFVLD